MKLKPRRSTMGSSGVVFGPRSIGAHAISAGIYMVAATCSVATIPEVPLASFNAPELFGWRNSDALNEIREKLKVVIYGPPVVEMSDAEYFGWIAAC